MQGREHCLQGEVQPLVAGLPLLVGLGPQHLEAHSFVRVLVWDSLSAQTKQTAKSCCPVGVLVPKSCCPVGLLVPLRAQRCSLVLPLRHAAVPGIP